MTTALIAYASIAVVIGATWAIGCWLLDADEMDVEFWATWLWRSATWPLWWRGWR